MSRNKVMMIALTGAMVIGWISWRAGAPPPNGDSTEGKTIVSVTLPALTGAAAEGADIFKSKCATCHGANAGGVDGKGPPLVHKYYEPGHHGDMAFVLAARQGVRRHHWNFGDMPAVAGVTDADIAAIIAYVRQVQKANGIF
ncbi:Cytochrome c [Roseovarius litorisediminis]|uniref:Cytochrome c n=1 Tax=Roseovarius litorisediminis TaxID=1312363 RepID=A0A1Y5T086_9RHOB|nr:Cytochrome c [Roseovarius litorisediminis]